MPFLHDRGHFFIKFIFLILICGPALVSCVDFDYDNQVKWPKDFPNCGGTAQSPISISEWNTYHTYEKCSPSLKILNFTKKLDKPYSLSISSLALSFDSPDTNVVIRGGPLKHKYYFYSCHWHWGLDNTWGSEHLVNGKRAALELHCIFINEKYLTIDVALKNRDGLAVLAVLYTATCKMKKPVNNGLNLIAEYLQFVNGTGPAYILPAAANISLSDLMGKVDTSEFATYHGSLTIPPCNEAATWIVFTKHLKVCPQLMDKLRKLRDNNNDRILHNNRALQKRNHRDITFFKRCEDICLDN